MDDILVIDIGNTAAKLAIYKGTDRQTEVLRVAHSQLVSVSVELCRQYGISKCMIASVVDIGTNFDEQLKEFGLKVYQVDTSLKMPYKLSETMPKSMGADRVAAVVASLMLPNYKDNILIIDAGTAITYEFIEKGNYIGGCIAPGLKMRFRALNQFTNKLPLCEVEDFSSWIGTTTQTAIAAGVLNGLNFEIDGYIKRFIDKVRINFTIIITGGDYKYLSLKSKNAIFASSNLVLDGIAYLYALNFARC